MTATEITSRAVGVHYHEEAGNCYAVASRGVDPTNFPAHTRAALSARYGAYEELARFPWTPKGKRECMAFADRANASLFSAAK